MRADLHIHTTASDGRWTPAQVIAEAQRRGIGLLAITDHDSVAHVLRGETLAREAGLSFLHGVEVSTLLDERIFHVLAYGFDLDSPALAVLLRDNRARLDQASDDIVHRLAAAGYEIDLQDYAAYEYDRARGGWKALNFLIDHGFCAGPRDYFSSLRPQFPAAQPAFPHPAEAIAVIRGTSGVPVLAHPGASLSHAAVTDETLRPFLDYGIAGLECYSYSHDEATTHFCLDWCARHDLLITGGSDCHGGFVERELGVPILDVADLRLGQLAERL
jgi:predicted metal-dependent phosphoesterase TrpH